MASKCKQDSQARCEYCRSPGVLSAAGQAQAGPRSASNGRQQADLLPHLHSMTCSALAAHGEAQCCLESVGRARLPLCSTISTTDASTFPAL